MSDNIDNAKLAQRLKECAAYVEHGEFHPQMYQVLADLHTYAGKHADGSKVAKTTPKDAIGSTLGGLANKLGKMTTTLAHAGGEHDKRHQGMSVKNDSTKKDLGASDSKEDDSWSARWAASTESKAAPAKPGKPAFQWPTNPKSTLIANGWIEQQRRSKLRVVWKDVLASLVEGRKPGEETTLWIQREVTNSTTGKLELEALHQVPLKWLQQVQYMDFYGDHRFNIKVYNVAEEFHFRCADADAAQNWVSTLKSMKEIDDRTRTRGATGASVSASQNMDDSRHSTTPAERKVPFVPSAPPAETAATTRISPKPDASEQSKPKLSVKEMRAIALGAGINTHGMERSDLERVVAKIQSAAPASTIAKTDSGDTATEVDAEEARRVAEADDEKRHQIDEEQRKRVAAARLRAEEEEKRRVIAAEEQQRAQALLDERRRVEEQRRQQAALEEQRRQAAAAEAHRVAEERRRQEEARQAHEAQQRYQQQQQQWQQQQAAQQQWQQQQAAAAQERARAAQAAQWQQWQQQQQRQQQQQQQQQPPAQNGHHQQQQQQQRPPQPDPQSSTADLKYTKMAQESTGSSAEKISGIKRNLLTHWALQPPQLSHLRQIADLLTTIHNVFPPAFNVVGHEYFKKWTPLKREDLIPVGAGPDEEKLKKAVRKLRFFLHPDKLPRDLNDEQTFMCKMLWDVSSDAWEEFKKRHEELDWIKK